ncbi:MAG: hypothetical protein KF774_12260 [Planctomyces sp.]|nr:hypothetical protein [Planctomyces sp.]
MEFAIDRETAFPAVFPMNDLRLNLSQKQQEILLRGLRYVRSSVALDTCDRWTPEIDVERTRQYAEIEELEAILNGVRNAEVAAAR